ncbi:MAG: DUF3301 domain-containing protein [Gammaproteobacteria bacterium]
MYLDLGTLTAILLLLALCATAWFWNDSLRARDRVITTCNRLCHNAGVQFLDETVALSGLRLQRSSGGSLEFARRYSFEYSETGSDRWQGYALLAGSRVESVQLHGPDGVTILGTPHSTTALPASPHPDHSTAARPDKER